MVIKILIWHIGPMSNKMTFTLLAFVQNLEQGLHLGLTFLEKSYWSVFFFFFTLVIIAGSTVA